MKTARFTFYIFLSLIFVSSALTAQIELESHWGGGKCRAVAMTNTHVFAGFGTFLYSIHLESSRITGVKNFPNTISDIAIMGNTAYVGSFDAGICVVDISDPENMDLVNQLECINRKLRISDNCLYVARFNNGLAVYDISTPTQPILLDELDISGTVYDVIPNGNYIYCSCRSAGLIVIDQTDLQALEINSTVTTTHDIYRLTQHNNYLYASYLIEKGMDILDVSVSQTPTLKNSITDEDRINDMQVQGNTLFVGSDLGIRLFDISDPLNPSKTLTKDVGSFSCFALGDSSICIAEDNEGLGIFSIEENSINKKSAHYELDFSPMKMYAVDSTTLYIPEYLSQHSVKLKILDVSNPTEPVDHGYCNVSATDIAIKDTIAYMIQDYKIYLVNISNPNQPVELGSITLPAKQKSLAIYKNYLFAYADGLWDGKGINIVDITNPLEPIVGVHLKHESIIEQIGATDSALFVQDSNNQIFRVDFTNPDNPKIDAEPLLTDSIVGCWVKDNIGYFTDVEDKLRTYDLSDPFQPEIKTTLNISQLKKKPLFNENLAYIVGQNGIEVFDFENPFSPIRVGFTNIPGHFTSPSIIGNNLVVLKVIYENKLSFFSLSTPTSPTLIDKIAPLGLNNAFAVKDNITFVANDLGGLRVLNMKNNSAEELGVLHTRGKVQDVVLQGNYAYLATEMEGMSIVDISDFRHPHTVGRYYPANNGSVKDVLVDGDYAYLMGGAYGIKVIDIKQKENPREVASRPVNWNLLSGTIYNELLYCCNSNEGIEVLDISNPLNPTPVGEYNTPGAAINMCIKNDTAYLADGMNSLRILNVSNPSQISEIAAYNLSPGIVNDVEVVGNYAFVTAGFMGLFVLDVKDPKNIIQVGRFFIGGCEFNEVEVENDTIFVCSQNNGVYKLSSSLLSSLADVTLSDLKVDGTTVPGFSPTTLSYDIEISSTTTVIPTVSATPNDINASVAITQADNVRGNSTILVTAEDGVTQQTYSIKFSNVTSISEMDEKTEFNLFPNPAQEKFRVQSSEFKVEDATIELYDLNGRKHLEKQITVGTNSVQIEVSNLKNGIYFCRILMNKNCFTQKIIIQRN